MSTGMEWTFWGSVLAIIYAYAGYPFVLSAIARLYRREPSTLAASDHQLPAVTMIVPVHNERAIIAEKLANTRQIEYPAGKLEVLFVSDGSTDGTATTIAANLDFRSTLIELEKRGGKAGALNAGLAKARHEIIVFSDASIMLAPDAVRNVIQPFQDSRIGCVSGEDWIPSGGGEGLYGRYELFLRRLESSVGSIVGASGSFYAQRRPLCDQFVPNVAPDFLSVLLTVSRGFRAVTCATARGRMTALDSVRDEFRRKVRTILRGITTVMGHSHLLNPFKHGLFAFELLSHKLARWLVPFFLLAMLASSAVLSAGSTLHAVLFAAQVVFYGLAVAGVYGPAAIRRLLVSRVAVYFTTVNLATLTAWLKFATGVRQEVWVPTRREGGPLQRTAELGDRARYESGSRR